MKFYAITAHTVNTDSREFAGLARATAKAWEQRLARVHLSTKLDADQWSIVVLSAVLGIAFLLLYLHSLEMLVARLSMVDDELEKLSSSRNASARDRRPKGKSEGAGESEAVCEPGSSSRFPVVEEGDKGHDNSDNDYQTSPPSYHREKSSAASSSPSYHINRGLSSVVKQGVGGLSRHQTRMRSCEDSEESEDDEAYQRCYEVEAQAIVEDMGISGLCLVTMPNKWPVVLLVAVQAFFLQIIILFYIAVQLESHPNMNAKKNLPDIIVDAAIYLHFINCVRDIPRAVFLARHFRSIYRDQDTAGGRFVFALIFGIDAFATPLAQLFIGALFLCTSATVADVILNGCAVAYISQIDNMILEVRAQMVDMESAGEAKELPNLKVHVNQTIIQALNMTFVVVPVFPVAFACFMGHLGLHVFQL